VRDNYQISPSSNHFIAWLQDLINPITYSLVGYSMNRKAIEVIKEANNKSNTSSTAL
jgi:hypothetical protein